MEEEAVILNKKYRLLEKVGSGSFGSIYACTLSPIKANTSTPGTALPPNSYSTPHAGKKGQRRRTAPVRNQTLPTLPRHQYSPPHAAGISRLYDYGTDKTHGRVFMVIELLELSLEELFQLWYSAD